MTFEIWIDFPLKVMGEVFPVKKVDIGRDPEVGMFKPCTSVTSLVGLLQQGTINSVTLVTDTYYFTVRRLEVHGQGVSWMVPKAIRTNLFHASLVSSGASLAVSGAPWLVDASTISVFIFTWFFLCLSTLSSLCVRVSVSNFLSFFFFNENTCHMDQGFT